MATKTAPSKKLLDAFSNVQPASPALSSADRTFLRGLHRRGFSYEEIVKYAGEAGYVVPADLFITKKKKTKVDSSQAS